jgi:hypothetical protein
MHEGLRASHISLRARSRLQSGRERSCFLGSHSWYGNIRSIHHLLRQPKLRQDCRKERRWQSASRNETPSVHHWSVPTGDWPSLVCCYGWTERTLDRTYFSVSREACPKVSCRSLTLPSNISSGIPFSAGMLLVFLSLMNYLVDCYVSKACYRSDWEQAKSRIQVIYAASVLAANSVLRSLFGFAFPLFVTQMYK